MEPRRGRTEPEAPSELNEGSDGVMSEPDE